MSQKENPKCSCLVNCRNTLKVINILFHGFLALLGVCIVLLAGIALCTDVSYDLITTLNYFINFRQCFGIGILAGFFLSIIGCFGVLSVAQGHNKRLSICLVFYVILIVLTMTIVLLTWSDKKINMENKLKDTMKNYGDAKVALKLDSLQKLLGCCGSTNSKDYANYQETFNASSLPGSCCKSSTKCAKEGIIKNADTNNIYETGCSNKIDFLVWPVIYGICAGIDGVMLFAIIFIILLIFSSEGSTCLEAQNEDSEECDEDEDDGKETNDDEEQGNEVVAEGAVVSHSHVVMQQQQYEDGDETQKLNPQV